MKQESKNTLLCPTCKTEIDVQEALYQQLDAQIRGQQQLEYAKTQKDLDEKQTELKNQTKIIEMQKTEIQELIQKGVNTKLMTERIKLEKRLRDQIVEEKSEELRAIQEQLNEKIQEAKELNKIRADYQKQLRLNEEMEGRVRAHAEEEFTQKLNNERKKLQKDIEDKMQFKVSEKEHIINQLKEQLTIAQQKASQGSMQIQGEVQENAIEDYLKSNFTMDIIQEIGKGQRGADILQIVHSRTVENCGSIYYESKRTKNFQNSWIDKFKVDMREKGATFGVLITEVMPEKMERFGIRDGIYVCTYEEFKGLCHILREAIILLKDATLSQENKGEKMQMLYEFLTSQEFKSQVEAMMEGLVQMNLDLETERRAIEGIWKKRQTQIKKVVLNTSNFYNCVKAIAGSSIESIKLLELPEINNEY